MAALTSAAIVAALVVAWVVLPGLILSALVLRAFGRRVPAAAFVGLALLGGTTWWVVVSEALVRLVGMTPVVAVTAAVTSAVLAAGAVVVGWRRRGPIGIDRWVPVVLVALAAVVAIGPDLVLVLTRPTSLVSSTSWYYWHLSQLLVGPRGVPSLVHEWGTRVHYLSDDIGFNASTAAWAAPIRGGHQIFAAQAVRIVVALLSSLGLGLLLLVWGGRVVVACASVIASGAIAVVASKLSSYRPESAGYGLLFLILLALTLALRASTAKQSRLQAGAPALALAAGGYVALSQIHGIVWVYSTLLVGGLLLAHLIVRPSGRSLMAVGIAGATLVLTWLSMGWLLSGRLFLGDQLSTLPKITPEGLDPTWLFRQLVRGRRLTAIGSPPSAGSLARAALTNGLAGTPSQVYFLIVVLALAVVVAGVVRPSWRRRSLGLLAFVVTVGVSAGVVSYLFAARWDTYVPRRTVATRVVILLGFLLPLALGAAPAMRARGRVGRGMRTVWAVVAVLLWVRAIPATAHFRNFQPTPSQMAAAEKARSSMKPGARVLTNGYSEGFVPAVLGADGLLDGRAPYTDAPLLSRATTLLVEARDFYANPGHHRDFLAREHVDYVLVSKGPWHLGFERVFPASLRALRLMRGSRIVMENETFLLIAVQPGASTP